MASGNKATLTDKQEKFVQELIKGKSQREAYRTAYPTSVKWLDTAVDCNASKVFSDAKVLQRYESLKGRLLKEAEDDCIITAKQVLQELANIALANGSDFAEVIEKEYPVKDKDGNLTGETRIYSAVEITPTESVDKTKRSAIAGIEQTQSGIKIKQHDKVKALELLGKHLGLFVEKVELTGKDGGPVEIESPRERIERRIAITASRGREKEDTE